MGAWGCCDPQGTAEVIVTMLSPLEVVRTVLHPPSGGEDAEPLGAEPLGADPLGADPLGAEPLGAGPLGADPLGAGPLGADPLGADPLGAGPLGASPLDSLGSEPLGAGPLGADPLGADSLGADPLGVGLPPLDAWGCSDSQGTAEVIVTMLSPLAVVRTVLIRWVLVH